MDVLRFGLVAALIAPTGILVGAIALDVAAPCAMAIANDGGFFIAWCPSNSGCETFDPPPACEEKTYTFAGILRHHCKCGSEGSDPNRRCDHEWVEDGSGHVTTYSCWITDAGCLPGDCKKTVVPAPVEGGPGPGVYACECVTPGVGGH